METKRAAAEEAPVIDYPMKRRNLGDKTSSISQEIVICNIDLLSQILLRLPARSAFKFKSVCKTWNSLISSRYFCLLWQQHRRPELLYRAPFSHFDSPLHRFDSHRCISLFGSNLGAIQFQLSRESIKHVLQSCNGFLLLKGAEDYWVYNPATKVRYTLPEPFEQGSRGSRTRYRTRSRSSSEKGVRLLELEEGGFHPGPCDGEIRTVSIAFDKMSNGRVIVLTMDAGECIHQIYVAEFGEDWRHSGQVFEYRGVFVDDGVYWNNSIVWLCGHATVCFDVDGEELRVGAGPPGTLAKSFVFEESSGHLHFIQSKDSTTLVVHEMMADLSAWFVKYSVSSSQIDPSGSRVTVYSLIELDKDCAVLVLRMQFEIVAYRIQDQKLTKICSWLPFAQPPTICGGPTCGYRYALPYIASILPFHASSCNKKVAL